MVFFIYPKLLSIDTDITIGDYIHKYFYDKSIADGYTLRIKKENIDTVAKSEIKKNLDIEDSKK